MTTMVYLFLNIRRRNERWFIGNTVNFELIHHIPHFPLFHIRLFRSFWLIVGSLVPVQYVSQMIL